jgi:hypothetical protein
LICLYAICTNRDLCDVAIASGAIGVCVSFLHSPNNIFSLNAAKVCWSFFDWHVNYQQRFYHVFLGSYKNWRIW